MMMYKISHICWRSWSCCCLVIVSKRVVGSCWMLNDYSNKILIYPFIIDDFISLLTSCMRILPSIKSKLMGKVLLETTTLIQCKSFVGNAAFFGYFIKAIQYNSRKYFFFAIWVDEPMSMIFFRNFLSNFFSLTNLAAVKKFHFLRWDLTLFYLAFVISCEWKWLDYAKINF